MRYLNILIHPKSRYITTFEYNGKYYNFSYLPFGLSISPFFMQMFANYIAEKFREFGIFAWIHVDNLLAAHDDKIFLYAITSFITFLLMKSGIRVNSDKSQLVPATQIEFLGSIWTQRTLCIWTLCIHVNYFIRKS